MRRVALVFFAILVTVSISSPVALELDPSHLIFHYHGSNTASQIGSTVACIGDINNDNYDDIAFNTESPSGTYIFLGGDPVDSIPDCFLKGDRSIAAGKDLTGDGISDLLISSYGVIYLYRGYIDCRDTEPFDSIVSPAGLAWYGALIRADYINDNNTADLLILAENPGVGTTVFLYKDPFVTDMVEDWSIIVDYTHQIRSCGFIDFDGDLFSDIYCVMSADYGLDTLGYVYIFCGPDFSTNPDYIIGHPIELDTLESYRFAEFSYDYNIGDVNGDGWDDLGIIFDLSPLVYFCGPGVDTVYDCQLAGSGIYMAAAGDINGDMYNDLVLCLSEDAYGRVAVFLGGAEFDIYRDGQLLRSDLPPLFLDDIGRRVESAGDFNGDGFADIIFSCLNFAYGDPGDVFIAAGGSDITSDVEEDESMIYPTQCVLYQNYPNPFNTSTTISFYMPAKSNVSLKIYNILGELEAILVDDIILPAGHHSVAWDGLSYAGIIASSGIYFYELKTGHYSQSKSMMILK